MTSLATGIGSPCLLYFRPPRQLARSWHPALPYAPRSFFDQGFPMTIHYPKRISRLKRKRSIGFRARMRTKSGRKLINRKRRAGRLINVADK